MEVSGRPHSMVTSIPEELTTVIAYEAARDPEPGNCPLGFKGPSFLDRIDRSNN